MTRFNNTVKTLLIILFTLFSVELSTAQTINNQQFPPETKWKRIDTEHFTLLFPEEIEEQAPQIASMLESYYEADEYSLETEIMRWPVIINNTLTESNAYVLGAPRHSQLYTIPSQDGFSGTADWIPFVWSHELRHIVQNDKMLQGFTAFANFIAGEYGNSVMLHFALPRWLMEGDAVLTETLLSSGGRGRLAGFSRGMRTDLLNGTQYNYYKASLGYYGSYKDTVPSWYVMGYHLCTYIRQKYGIEAFNRIIDISADFSFTPLIFNIAVKNVTGDPIREIYSDCLDELTELWLKQLEGRYLSTVDIIKKADEKTNAGYYPLGVFEDGRMAALKVSSAEIPRLVAVDNSGAEKVLREISPIDKNISFNGSQFCWAESKKDPRWGNLSWSVIRKYDPATGEYRLLTEKTRYLSPSISPDGTLIAAVEISPELNSFIVVIDAETGQLKRRIAEPAGAAPSQTCWSEDGKNIIYVRQYDWTKSLRMLDLLSGSNRELTAPSAYNITDPAVMGGRVYYVSDESGIENIYSTGIDEGSAEPAVSGPFGTASPAAGEGRLLFADYSAEGFSIAFATMEAMKETSLAFTGGNGVEYFDGLQDQEPWAGMAGPGTIPEEHLAAKDYDAADYNIATGLFNFHSRSLDTTMNGTGLALSFIADDIFNYSSGKVYTGWDAEEGELAAGLSGAWAGFYPVLLYGAEIRTPIPGFGEQLESDIYGGIWLPLNFSSGIINHTLSLQETVFLDSRLYPSAAHALVSQASISWQFTKQAAKRDIVPQSGISVSAFWLYSIIPSKYNFVSAESDFYFPGLFKNQGLTLSLSADYNADSAAIARKPKHAPRGYSTEDFTGRTLLGGSAEYTIPLFYPDLALGGFIYIPRLFMNCFIDAAYDPANAGDITSTTGFELFTDFYLFGNTVPLQTGIRFIYDINDGGMRIEDTVLLLGIDIP